jgi:flagellum-specific peptidoglycan hydrolase FlgJ
MARYPLILVFLLVCGLKATADFKRASEPISTVQELNFEDRVLKEIQATDTRGIDARYILAIAVLETGSGKGYVYKNSHNLFNIKADNNYAGKVFTGIYRYRAYLDDNSSIVELVTFLTTRSRYRQAYRYALLDERKKFFKALQESGYSEDAYYAKKLEACFQTFQRRETNKRLAQFKILGCSINLDSACPTLSR